MIDLKDKNAVVTGGSRGIGRATALMLAQAGCDVLVHYHSNEQAADSIVSDIRALGHNADKCRAEISRREEAEKLIDQAIQTLGGVDILVNNAGIWEEAAIDRMSDEDLRRTIEINLLGPFHTCSAVAPYMIEHKRGTIINIASTAGLRGEAFHAHYAASKSGVIGLTKSLAAELAPHNIRVNCVAPGWTDTDLTKDTMAGDEAVQVLSKIPLGRIALPEEIAGCVVFLASNLAGFVTGEVLNANGGAVLCG